jgi:hypothetical protein
MNVFLLPERAANIKIFLKDKRIKHFFNAIFSFPAVSRTKYTPGLRLSEFISTKCFPPAIFH